jgi:lipopolysaccharide transport system ATP-binding protein
VAAHLDPEVLIVDEVLAVGDAEFQRRCLGKMKEVSGYGKTVLFVSHSMSAVLGLTQRCVLLKDGKVAEIGTPEAVVESYVGQGYDVVTVPLGLRKDREGNQTVRFSDFHILNKEYQRVGSVPTCSRAILRYFYESNSHRQIQNLHISAGVFAETGECLLHIATDVASGDFNNVGPRGFVDCEIPSLTLQPGKYLMNFYMRAEGSISDWVRSAAVLIVAEGDPFGTGRLPERGKGYSILKHSWKINDSGIG